jgi:hypothetical protein
MHPALRQRAAIASFDGIVDEFYRGSVRPSRRSTVSSMSSTRQRAAIASFDGIVDEFYDAAVSGADPAAKRPGFKGHARPYCRQRRPDDSGREPTISCADHRNSTAMGRREIRPSLARPRVAGDAT